LWPRSGHTKHGQIGSRSIDTRRHLPGGSGVGRYQPMSPTCTCSTTSSARRHSLPRRRGLRVEQGANPTVSHDIVIGGREFLVPAGRRRGFVIVSTSRFRTRVVSGVRLHITSVQVAPADRIVGVRAATPTAPESAGRNTGIPRSRNVITVQGGVKSAAAVSRDDTRALGCRSSYLARECAGLIHCNPCGRPRQGVGPTTRHQSQAGVHHHINESKTIRCVIVNQVLALRPAGAQADGCAAADRSPARQGGPRARRAGGTCLRSGHDRTRSARRARSTGRTHPEGGWLPPRLTGTNTATRASRCEEVAAPRAHAAQRDGRRTDPQLSARPCPLTALDPRTVPTTSPTEHARACHRARASARTVHCPLPPASNSSPQAPACQQASTLLHVNRNTRRHGEVHATTACRNLTHIPQNRFVPLGDDLAAT